MKRLIFKLNHPSSSSQMSWLKAAICTVLYCISMASYAEAPFGRLFTTPTERANLDYLRKTAKPASLSQEPSETNSVSDEPLVTEPPAAVSMQGYVKRSDGKKSTVWINNTPMQESSSNSEVQIGTLNKANNQVQIKVPANNKHLSLKAGQVYDPESNQVLEKSAHARLQAERELEDAHQRDDEPESSQRK